MCGIAGIYNKSGMAVDSSTIRSMCDAMVHRGPDAGGYLTEDGIALGHRRLSIIDLSDAANQPFTDASGRYTLVFNGELYNYREVRNMLPAYPFRTSSDTEVLVAAFAAWERPASTASRGCSPLPYGIGKIGRCISAVIDSGSNHFITDIRMACCFLPPKSEPSWPQGMFPVNWTLPPSRIIFPFSHSDSHHPPFPVSVNLKQVHG